MPDRTPREIAHSIALHREQLVDDVHELENIVRYYLALPSRIRQQLQNVHISPLGYAALAGAGIAAGVLGYLALRR